jgi:serine/threonine protein kinase
MLKVGAGTQAPGSTRAPNPGGKFTPPSPEVIASFFPQLEILAFIGQGGMGAVYKARQPNLDRLVALKILPPSMDDDPGFAERFTREARTLAKLSHPNIVAIYDFGQSGGYRYFLMEYVDGLNLRQIEQSGKLSPREALTIVPQLCDALQFAHDAGIVHRDIKPENILLDKRGRVKIADFGLAKLLGQESRDYTITEAGHVMGTPHYMAPEQVEKPLEVDHRADIYSLGVVFYEMLTGELPLGRFASPSQKVRIDVRLDDVVLRALEKEPARRYQHASQFKTAVDTIAATPASPPPPAAATANQNDEWEQARRQYAPPPPAPPPTPAVLPTTSSSTAKAWGDALLARDYTLNIGHCLSRGWNLIWSDFWPLVGVNALVFALFSVTNSFSFGNTTPHANGFNNTPSAYSVLWMLVYGPLAGGLRMYYLRKIRSQPVSIETLFSGFSGRYLHLFLGGFVSSVLIVLGFFCLILPGIYLWVAWSFALVLIIDRRLEFWPALELSRRVIGKHWWAFFGFTILSVLIKFLGICALFFGIFVAGPIVLAAWLYAYEDIFGAHRDQGLPQQS